jgi:hypothetical protein
MDISCPTCLNPFTLKCDISATHCGHVFHTLCILKWLQTGKKTCPSCRKDCTMLGTKKLFFSADGTAKKRDANQADLNRAKSEAKRLKSEMAEKDEINKSMHEWIFEKNPSDKDGTTLLHWAAENGHLDICKSILEEVEDKNPKVPSMSFYPDFIMIC